MKRTLSIAAAVALSSVCCLGATGPIGSVRQNALAYDEVTRIVMGDTAPEPGTFSTDFDAAVNAQKSVAAPGSHHGLLGGIMNAMDTAKNAMSLLQAGSASSKYYFAAMERTDDPGAQTATISKPQQHQIIYLNLAKKTYRVVDTNVQTVTEAPPSEQSTRTAAPPAQPGSGKLDVTVSSTSLGPRVIENVPTTGYKTTFTVKETDSSGSCTDGTFQTSMVEYVSKYSSPRAAATAVTRTPYGSSARPETMALKPGCSPTITTHSSGGAHPDSGRLPMWMLVTVGAGAPSAQGPMNGGFSMLVERGNVRSLGPSDKTLFDIPSNFTKEQ